MFEAEQFLLDIHSVEGSDTNHVFAGPSILRCTICLCRLEPSHYDAAEGGAVGAAYCGADIGVSGVRPSARNQQRPTQGLVNLVGWTIRVKLVFEAGINKAGDDATQLARGSSCWMPDAREWRSIVDVPVTRHELQRPN